MTLTSVMPVEERKFATACMISSLLAAYWMGHALEER
jgi:hypothetical protein